MISYMKYIYITIIVLTIVIMTMLTWAQIQKNNRTLLVRYIDTVDAKVELQKNGEIEKVPVKNGELLNVKKGVYSLSITGENIKKKTLRIDTADQQKTEVTLDISYTDKYLDTLLTQAKPSIDQALKASYPSIETTFSIRSEKLYGDGSWYGARLRYKGSDDSSRDTLRLIAKRGSDNTWRLISKPPQIILSYKDHPEVPKNIIDDINSDNDIKIQPIR